MQKPVLQIDRWEKLGVDQRIIDALVQARPQSAEEIARVYGQVIRGVWGQETDLQAEIGEIDRELAALDGGEINLVDIVAGGNGFGTDT